MPCKKIEDSIRKEYLPLKIYLDQIEDIINILEENNIDYTIQTSLYKYDNLPELINSSKETIIKKIKISAGEPYINIELDKRWATLYICSNKAFAAGVSYKIDRILKESQRFLSFSYNYYFIFAINLINFLPILIKGEWQPYSKYIVTVFNIIWTLWLIKILYIRYSHHVAIQLTKKANTLNFFQRKKDDLILALVSGLIGAILGAITTKYVH